MLDYLSRRFTYNSREKWAELIALGRLQLDGRRASPDDALREGQHLLFQVVDYHEPEVPLDWHVLPMEGEAPHPEDLMFVHKPAGMPVHKTGKIFFNTLANLVKERMGGEWAPLNRLDRETSGIVAFARGPDAFRAYAPATPGNTWTKLYVAVVQGEMPGDGVGRIEQPLGELPGDEIRTRMHVHLKGKRAVSLYLPIARVPGYSLVLLSPITGRKHQLRAHLAWLGFPVVGDKIYSGGGKAYLARANSSPSDEGQPWSQSHMLHSLRLEIKPGDRASSVCEDGSWTPDGGMEWTANALRTWRQQAGPLLVAISSEQRNDTDGGK